MTRNKQRNVPLRIAAGLAVAALVVGACSNGESAEPDATPPAPDTPADTPDPDPGSDDGDTSDTTSAPQPTLPSNPEPDIVEPDIVEPVIGGTLRVGGEAEAGTPWVPAAMTCDSFCHMRVRTFLEPLAAADDQLDVVGYLAESITANDDHTEFTIVVRDGIEFHDGTPLNAEAVADNLQRAATGVLLGPALKDLARDDNGALSIDILDEHTLTLFTGRRGDINDPLPWPLFPYYLTGQAGLIASPTWMAAVDSGDAREIDAVGTGPFTIDEFIVGDSMTVVRNDNYWRTDNEGRQLPYLDAIRFVVIQDSQVRAAALEGGDLDLIATSDARVVGELANSGRYETVYQTEFGESGFLLLNTTVPHLADRDVRCALSAAIDRDDLNDVVSDGYGVPSRGLFSPGQEGYLADPGGPAYDPDAARNAIAAWEAANGPLTIQFTHTPSVTNQVLAGYLADVWGDIGVNLDIRSAEQSSFIVEALFGFPEFEVFTWRNHGGLFVDQQNFWWHSDNAAPPGEFALNFGRINDPVIDEALDAAREETDPDVRSELAETINRQLADECYAIPLSSTIWGVTHTTDVANIGQNPTPDGDAMLRDGAGFSGQVWLTNVFLDR